MRGALVMRAAEHRMHRDGPVAQDLALPVNILQEKLERPDALARRP